MPKLSGLILLFIFNTSAQAGVWEVLTSIHPASAKPNDQIKELISKPIEISGFSIADEFKEGEINDFLLTQTPSGCIHSPLPAPNQIIHVVLQNNKTIPDFPGKRLVIHGVLSMSERSDSVYELKADSVKPSAN